MTPFRLLSRGAEIAFAPSPHECTRSCVSAARTTTGIRNRSGPGNLLRPENVGMGSTAPQMPILDPLAVAVRPHTKRAEGRAYSGRAFAHRARLRLSLSNWDRTDDKRSGMTISPRSSGRTRPFSMRSVSKCKQRWISVDT